MSSEFTIDLLKISLSAAVPLWVDTILRENWSVDRLQRESAEAAQEIAEHGDRILFKSKGTAQAFNALAKGIAILSFCPGGIEVFGLKFGTNTGPCKIKVVRDGNRIKFTPK